MDYGGAIVLSVLLSAACGYIAQTKGRNAGLWMLAAALASPILVGIVVLVVAPTRKVPA
jgi:hypothetical protein